MPHGLVLRARIVLASAKGLTNTAVARRLAISLPTVGKWRRRFLALGVQGLHDDARPGRPRTYDDEKVATVIHRALHARPADSGTCSVRRMADAEGVSKSTVQRWFALFGVKPHLAETFKLSDDPCFIEKVRDVTGLYLNPPDDVVVLCVDEKTRIQAPDRTQPALPRGLGYAEGYTHAHVRRGTTTLFAALDVATRKVLARCRKRHRHQEWLAFLRLMDREAPEGLDLHLVRQLRQAQAREGARLGRQATVHPSALHPDLRLLAEPGRAPVRAAQRARHQARHVPQRHGTQAADHGVHRAVQRVLKAVRMGGNGLFDLGEARAYM